VTAGEEITEGENTTAWQVDIVLDDHTFYYWRARAFDGINYSAWMNTARFFVNTANDPPSVPNISTPPDQAEVPVLQPTLEINNSINVDADSLTYEFEVYSDQNMTTLHASKSDVLEGGNGSTSWQIDMACENNAFYWWRAQARDSANNSSGWTTLFSFLVNTNNESPSAPSINNPQNEIDSLYPTIEVNNATDADTAILTYFFEIDKLNNFSSSSLKQSPEIQEGENTSSWGSPELEDNTLYYWRARAYDGAAYSQWATGSFFVNLFNEAPTMPTINNPADNTEVLTLIPTLKVNPSFDVDMDQINYEFELYSDAAMTILMSSTATEELSWDVDVTLEDNAGYFWRVRAVDEHGAVSDWPALTPFIVNINFCPTTPSLNNPVSGGIVTTVNLSLSINNADDPDNGSLYYEFELFSDGSLINKVASSIVPQGNIITSWTVPLALTNNSIYYWRVRANDGNLAGSWMPTAVFMVNTSGVDTIVNIEVSEEVSSAEVSTRTVEVTNNDSPIKGVSLQIPAGGLSDDCTITIGVINNPPVLPSGTKAIGQVIEFGPSGTTFLLPVIIKIPYTQADLDNAGLSDPSQLEILTYNTATLSWAIIPVDSIDTANKFLICQVDHFSMFTLGLSIQSSVDTNEDSSAGNEEGSGGCFIDLVKFH